MPASTLLNLQRTAGNQAVNDLLRRRRPALWAQRVAVVPSWSGSDDTSWNKRARTVTGAGAEASAGASGVLRIPVEGITVGHSGEEADEWGGNSDPNIKVKGGAPVKTVTNETVGTGEAGRAIVLMPPGLTKGPLDILFHLHGHTIGYRQVKAAGARPAPPPRDVQYDRVAQQLLESGAKMIAILPQGKFKSGFGPGEQKGVNVDAYVGQVFGLANLEGFTPGRVTLSGWSGAGAGIAEMINGSKAEEKIKEAQSAGKKTKPRDSSASQLPELAHFEGLFLFDALYGNQGATIWGWLQAKLESEIGRLVEIGRAGTGPGPAAAAAAQVGWIQANGFRFRGIFTVGQGSGSEKNYVALRGWLDNWFKIGPHLKKITQGVVSPDVLDELHKNYQVVEAGAGVTHNQMIGGVGKGDLYQHENLRDALESLPPTPAGVAGQPVHGRAATPAASRPVTAASRPSPVHVRKAGHTVATRASARPEQENGTDIAARYALSEKEREQLKPLETDIEANRVAQDELKAFARAHKKKKLTPEERTEQQALQKEAARLKALVSADRKAFKKDNEKATLAKRDIEVDLKGHGIESLAKWYGEIDTGAHFLGVPIENGIHADLKLHLQQAEAILIKETKIEDAKELGVAMHLKQAKGLRSPKPATGGTRPSMHCYGLAVDLNYAGSPFIGNAEAGLKPAKKGESVTSKVIARAELLVYQQEMDILDPHQVKQDVGEQYEFLSGVSGALSTYLQLPAQPKKLDELVGRLQKSGKDARDATAWRQQIEKDHAALMAKGTDFSGHTDAAQGFLDLDKKLVLALTQAGLTWGGMYQTGKDIMHFDYRSGTIKR